MNLKSENVQGISFSATFVVLFSVVKQRKILQGHK